MDDQPFAYPEFSSLYRSTIEPLQRHLLRLLKDRTEAEDIAHDAYLRVYASARRQEIQHPEALLFTTARRLAFNRLRRRRIAPFVNQEPKTESAASPAPGVVQQVIARQEWGRIQAAINQLPDGCRTVLLLRKVDLLSHRDIAQRLGISVSTVEKQHARALRLLKEALQPDQATPPTPSVS